MAQTESQPPHLHCPDCGAPVKLEPGHHKTRCPHCSSTLTYHMGLRGRAALVSLRCPGCGASAEYPEDAHNVTCSYCDGKHIVTGEGRALRLYVPPRLPKDGAEAELRKRYGTKGWHREDGQVAYAPYWRYRGMVYMWETGIQRRADDEDGIFGAFSNIHHRKLHAKSQDRSIHAGDFGFGWPSLGTRLGMVNQAAYDPQDMARSGSVLEPAMRRQKAMQVMTAGATETAVNRDLSYQLQHGTLVGGKLSMVWYPYWIFPADGGKRLVVDAAGGGVLPETQQVPKSAPVAISAEVPSLIPAECPKCGTGFEGEGFEKLFFCEPCQAAWRLEGRQLVQQDCHTIAPGRQVKADAHFPMWCIRVSIHSKAGVIQDQKAFRKIVPGWNFMDSSQDPKKPIHLYIPAWGNRLQPRFSNVARRYNREQPDLRSCKQGFGRVIRSIFGPKEALELAQIHLLGVLYLRQSLASSMIDARVKTEAMGLYLLPFRKGHHEWHDNVTGTAIPLPEVGERSF